MTSPRNKLAEWLQRYLLIELIGTACELGCAAIGYLSTGSLAVAALAATIGANLGYYGPAWWRAYRSTKAACHLDNLLARTLSTSVRATWCVAVEFGPGEAVDSLLVRPALFYSMPILLAGWADGSGPWVLAGGWVIGKVLADIVFYACTVTSYEINKSRLPAVDKPRIVRPSGEDNVDEVDIPQSAG